MNEHDNETKPADDVDDAQLTAWRRNPRLAWKADAIAEHRAFAHAAEAGKLPKNPDRGGTFTRGADGSLSEAGAEE